MNQGDTKGKSILDRGDIKYKSSVLRKSQEVRVAGPGLGVRGGLWIGEGS